jgi:CcmD family protein
LNSKDLTVLFVALVVWGLLFGYLLRLERRVRDLERK